MRMIQTRRNAGVTFVELMVATGIMSLMFGAIGFLVILTGRNTILVSEQALSQNNASAAAERITNLVRNASGISAFSGDDISTSLTRIQFHMPETGNTGCIAFVPPSATGKSDGVVKVFLDVSKYSASTLKTDKADYTFSGVEKFAIGYRTPTWMSMSVFYSYRSYMNFAGHNETYNDKLAGEFVTDVIAKNHHPGESGNYAHTTTSVFLL